MKKKTIQGILPFITFALLASCNSNTENLATQQKTNEKVLVQVVTATMSDVEQSITFTGTVEAETVNNIAPQTSARIKKIYAEVGDHVRAGQLLAEMDAVNLQQTRLQLENDKLEFERVDRLYQVGGISKSEWDAKKLALELSETSYRNLQENTALISPISGIVSKRNYDSGDMFSMGSPIYVVECIRPVKLMVNVSEALFTKIQKGMNVGLTLDVYGNEVFTGKVKLVHPMIDPDTRTFPVEVQIENSDERIRSGMFARVTFNYGTENRVLISDRAILKQTGAADRYVFIVKDGVAEYRKVVLGNRVGDNYEIIEGIQNGELVAITGQTRLTTGAQVTMEKVENKITKVN